MCHNKNDRSAWGGNRKEIMELINTKRMETIFKNLFHYSHTQKNTFTTRKASCTNQGWTESEARPTKKLVRINDCLGS